MPWRLVVVVRFARPLVAHRHAGFPHARQGLGRHLLLGRAIVFVAAADAAIDDNQARLMPAGHGGDGRHVDVLLRRPHLAPIEPKDVDRPVAAHDLLDDAVREVDERRPTLRLLGRVVVRVSREVRPGGVPVARLMPIALGIVGPDAETFLAEGVEYCPDDVGAGIGMERAGRVGRAEVGLPRVEQAEAVVVLGGKDHVFHAGPFGGVGPGLRVEVPGMEGSVELDVVGGEPLHVLAALDPCRQVVGPGPLVFLHQRPRFDRAPLAVDSPVHHEAELPVLEGFQLL